MRKTWLAALLLVCLSSLLIVKHAAAQTPYTDSSLATQLISRSDVGTALSAVGSSDTVTDVADSTPSEPGDLAAAVRVFVTNNGAILIGLFANSDGSAPSSDQVSLAMSGGLLQGAAGAVIDNISGYTSGGPAGLGDQDQTSFFTGSIAGTPVTVVGDTFVKGNIIAFVFYALPSSADQSLSPQTVGAVSQLQVMNLP